MFFFKFFYRKLVLKTNLCCLVEYLLILTSELNLTIFTCFSIFETLTYRILANSKFKTIAHFVMGTIGTKRKDHGFGCGLRCRCPTYSGCIKNVLHACSILFCTMKSKNSL